MIVDSDELARQLDDTQRQLDKAHRTLGAMIVGAVIVLVLFAIGVMKP